MQVFGLLAPNCQFDLVPATIVCTIVHVCQLAGMVLALATIVPEWQRGQLGMILARATIVPEWQRGTLLAWPSKFYASGCGLAGWHDSCMASKFYARMLRRVALFFPAIPPKRIPMVQRAGGPLRQQVRQASCLPRNPDPQIFL